MKILITGGLGYIGAKLGLVLKEKGYDVFVYDKPNDILDTVDLRQKLDGMDVVYHLAALAELSYTDTHPQETYDVNILGTNNIAQICAEKNILLNFVSTCCIYGNPLEDPSVEDRLINPSDTYAMSKASGEYLIKMWGLSKGLRYNILRFGTVYGESTDAKMRSDMAIQKFIDAAVNHLPIQITGNGEQARKFVHIDDLTRALVLITEKNICGEIMNLCGEERVSINEIAKYAQELGVGEITYISSRKDDFIDQNASIEKAKILLDWKPEIKFKDGIKRMYNWYVINNNTVI